jgi:hypothetical protein
LLWYNMQWHSNFGWVILVFSILIIQKYIIS